MSRVKPLTARQTEVLTFIRSHIAEHWYPPTLREIGSQFDISSTVGVSDHLRALARKGYIAISPAKTARGIRVLPDPDIIIAGDPRWHAIPHSAEEE